MLLFFALLMPQLAFAQSCHLPRQTLLQEVLAAVPLPKTLRERYYIAHEGGPIEFETCSRPRIRLSTSTRVCMAGNGSYPMHWVEDVDSAILQELSQLGVTEVRWICEANPGFNIARKLPKRLTLVLPTQAERKNSGMRLEIPCITTREQWEFGAKAARDLLRGAKSDLPSTLQMFAAANRSLVEAALRGKAESAQSQALTAGAFNLAVGLKYDWHIGGAAQLEAEAIAVFPELSLLAQIKDLNDVTPYFNSAHEKATKMTPHCSAPMDFALCKQELAKLQQLLMENGIWDERVMTGGTLKNGDLWNDPRLAASAMVWLRSDHAEKEEMARIRQIDPAREQRILRETTTQQWSTGVKEVGSAVLFVGQGVSMQFNDPQAYLEPACKLDMVCVMRQYALKSARNSYASEGLKRGVCYQIVLTGFDGIKGTHQIMEIPTERCPSAN